MKLPKIMQADFEASLNISDDSLIKYMIEDTEKRKIFNGKGRIRTVILFIFLVGILFAMSAFSSKGTEHRFEDSPVPKPDINFLPIWVFILFLMIWFFFWLYSRKINYINNQTFTSMFNANNYIIWLTIEMNLLFLTFFLKPLTIFGIVLFFGAVFIISYMIFKGKKQALEKQLFNVEGESNKLDEFIQKTFQFIIKYGGILVIIYFIWKFLFPQSTEVRTDIVGFIGIIAMCFVMDIAIVAAEAYLFLPYLLYGYYKYKYPEEYREWEGKTQLEWYGEKYFNKHIKGTEKEEK